MITIHRSHERVSFTAKPPGAYAGQTLVEWTLLLTLIGLTCIASLSQLGTGINTTLADVTDGLMGNNVNGNMGDPLHYP